MNNPPVDLGQSKAAATDGLADAGANEGSIPSGGSFICDDCEEPTTWKYAVQHDPWFKPTGEVYCENCAERRWDSYQEYLMETT